MKTKTVKGYKVFDPDFRCRGFQFKEGKTFTMKEPISICNSGFHFCLKANDCFDYYSFDSNNIVCEVEAIGKVELHNYDSKACTDKIKIGRRLTWNEVLELVNIGKDNSGRSNSGNWNSGDRNSGDSNSGYRNSGDWNSGDSNSGYWNSGNGNSGDWNSGNWNSGDRNSGDSNSGDWNSGNWNSGDRNSGDSNSGYRNSGNGNSGDWNSGNWNSGDRNSGDSNSGYRNNGAFCTDNNPELYLFNKPSGINVRTWEQSRPVSIMRRLRDFTIWVDSGIMTDEEKKQYPKHNTTGGYIKTIPLKEAWANMWGNLSDDDKKEFTSLPNFDNNIFFEITGIQVKTRKTKSKK